MRNVRERAYEVLVCMLHKLCLWGRVPACALCSKEDLQSALRAHPLMELRMLLHPAHPMAVLL